MRVKALRNTILKPRPLDSSSGTFTPDELVAFPADEIQELTQYEAAANKHFRLHLANPIAGETIWYVFREHIEIQDDQSEQILYPPTLPQSVKLDVPYCSQMDNLNNPTGSCNVSSVAMTLLYYDLSGDNSDLQLEDELYEYMERHGLSRHCGFDLAIVAEDYGAHVEYTQNGSIELVRQALAEGKPTILAGYFTRFGHILVAVGYDENGLFVHDPYGEWHSWGYQLNDDINPSRGMYLHYSYALIERTCAPDGAMWVHVVGKSEISI